MVGCTEYEKKSQPAPGNTGSGSFLIVRSRFCFIQRQLIRHIVTPLCLRLNLYKNQSSSIRGSRRKKGEVPRWSEGGETLNIIGQELTPALVASL